MALAHESIATISNPQFINLTPDDINPLMSKCDIKVFYLGKSRNQTYVDKATALEMAKTLRGAPIVGAYKQDKQDFSTHGDQVVFDDEGIHFNCLTKPYGFVSTDANVWFQKFKERDDFGFQVQRQYMMTTGYLWTGQYPEANQVFEDGGKPHSMELDEESLEGHWSTQNNSNVEFFIISNAIFSKLCILGDKVEPCYEGSGITKPEISTQFTKDLDDKFKRVLFTMMNEMQKTIKGEKNMAENEKIAENAAVVEGAKEPETQATLTEQAPVEASVETSVPVETPAEEAPAAEFAEKKEKEEEEKKEETSDEDKEDDKEDKDKEEKKEDPKTKNTVEEETVDYESKFTELQAEFSKLQSSYNELMEFKKNIEDKEKDTLIDSFFMLSDEDKKDVVEHKAEYSLEDIKSKLAVKCFDKKVNFNLDTFEKNDNNIEEKSVAVTYEIGSNNPSLPDWIKEVKEVEKNSL